MKLLPHILNRIVIIRAEIAADGACVTEVFVWRRGALAAAGWADVKYAPAIAVVCGYGVVTKADDSQVVGRVKSDPETFLWSSADGQTTFVRRERLQGLTEELAARRVVPVQMCCADADAEFGAVAAACASRFYETLTWRTLGRIDDRQSSVAQAAVRRAALPVLGCFLALLVGNTFLAQRLISRRQLLQAQYAAYRRNASDAESADARQQQLFRSFAARPEVPYAVACDRIAGAVPEYVVLTSLELEPLTARFEAGKPLPRRQGIALVCGTASAASDISEFVRRLGEGFGSVRLAGIEKVRDSAQLTFQIEINL